MLARLFISVIALSLSGCFAGKGDSSGARFNTPGTGDGTPPSLTASAFGPPPTLSLVLSATAIQPGESATLTWDSENADSCTASGAWSGQQPPNNTAGTSTAPQSAGTYSYGLTCFGSYGTVSRAVTLAVGVTAAPAVTLSLSAPAVQPGQTVILNWAASNATSCVGVGGTGSDGWAGPQATSNSTGLIVGPFSTVGAVPYELDCTGPGGQGSATRIEMVSAAAPPAPPTVSISAAGLSVQTGQSVTLTWNSTNADSCVGSGGTGNDSWSGAQPTASTGTAIGPLPASGTYTYTLNCFDNGGSTAQSVIVTVTPSVVPTTPGIHLSVNPTSISSGGVAYLTWSTTDTSDCTASGSWAGSQPLQGSAIGTGTLITQGVYSYTLTCNGPGGGVTHTASLTVTAPAATISSLSVAPGVITEGQSAVATWNSSDASTCTGTGGAASDGWGGAQPLSSSGATVGPITAPGTYLYSLTCQGPGGSSQPSTATLLVNAAPPVPLLTSFTATPNVLTVGQPSSLAWQTLNATQCSATGGFSGDNWAGTQATASQGLTLGPFNSAGTYTYTLNCSGAGGVTGDVSITISVAAPIPPPTISSFIANPTTLTAGQSTTLSWATSSATSCIASGGTGSDTWTGSIPTASSGTPVGPLGIAGSYPYILTCSGPGGSTGPVSVDINVGAQIPAPTITSFTASPNTLTRGQSVQLNWTSLNATSCVATGGSGSDAWPGSVATAGAAVSLGPLISVGTVNYVLQCSGAGGTSAPATVAVTVEQPVSPANILSFAATPTAVHTGDSSALAWATSDASSCMATGGTGTDGWNGSVAISGASVSVGPLTTVGSVTYTLTCTGAGGSSGPSSTTVAVGAAIPPPSITALSALPNSIQVGQSTTLSWLSSNATACTASGGTGSDGWSGTQSISSSGLAIGPFTSTGTYTYTLSCSGAGGSSGPASVTVLATPAPVGPPVVTLTANNAATAQIQPGTSFTLKWSTTNASSCSASGGTGSDGWSGSRPVSSSGLSIGPVATPGVYTYSLSCSGTGGSSTQSVVVTVISSAGADCGLPTPTTALLAPAASVSSQALCLGLGCAVYDEANVINADLTDYASMDVFLGIGSTVSVTVTDGTTQYPAGRKAGFIVSSPAALLSLSLLSGVTIQTLLGTTVQETATSADLLRLDLLFLGGGSTGYAQFTTTKPFNAVRVNVISLVGLLTQYNAYSACVSLQ
jgi:trimeric autotransporter adhesin